MLSNEHADTVSNPDLSKIIYTERDIWQNWAGKKVKANIVDNPISIKL